MTLVRNQLESMLLFWVKLNKITPSGLRLQGNVRFKDTTLELAKAKHDVESQTHSDRIKFDNLVSLIYERYNSKQFRHIIDTIVSSTDVLDRFREQIEKLEKSVGSFTGDGMSGNQ